MTWSDPIRSASRSFYCLLRFLLSLPHSFTRVTYIHDSHEIHKPVIPLLTWLTGDMRVRMWVRRGRGRGGCAALQERQAKATACTREWKEDSLHSFAITGSCLPLMPYATMREDPSLRGGFKTLRIWVCQLYLVLGKLWSCSMYWGNFSLWVIVCTVGHFAGITF